jgi:DNA-binding IclR family transcriptional regulator
MKTTLQTLDRGIEVLLLLAGKPNGMQSIEVAEALGLKRAVAYRILGTLARHGLVRRLEDGRMMLGGTALQLGARVTDIVRGAALPVLENLADVTSATSYLTTAEAGQCVVFLAVGPREPVVSIHYRVGIRHPLERGAAGIAILANRAPLADDGPDILLARRQGYIVTRGQLHRGAVGVASPVILPEGFEGLEYSIGVVALEALDISIACEAVPAAASELACRLA